LIAKNRLIVVYPRVRDVTEMDRTPSGLLVSVRSASEGVVAVLGGASVVDLKEPLRGPLGRADAAVWRETRRAVPAAIPMSVALGEIADWNDRIDLAEIKRSLYNINYIKIGFARTGSDWRTRWREVRKAVSAGRRWVAAIYVDHERAESPHPDEIVAEAIALDECVGVLFDTWAKGVRDGTAIDISWKPTIDAIRSSGRFIALAGGLDDRAIGGLASLRPDLFAVRGAACRGGDRIREIELDRVVKLARASRIALDNDDERTRFKRVVL
jgi:uncharacterized protein (UPF0264 family)